VVGLVPSGCEQVRQSECTEAYQLLCSQVGGRGWAGRCQVPMVRANPELRRRCAVRLHNCV